MFLEVSSAHVDVVLPSAFFQRKEIVVCPLLLPCYLPASSFYKQSLGPEFFLSDVSGGYIQRALRPKRVSKAK